MARLVTATATTGWRDWVLGQLWILDDGLLRVPLGLGYTLAFGLTPGRFPGDAVEEDISREEAMAAALAQRRAVWVGREEIAEARLRAGFMVDSLRLRLADGRTVHLMWLSVDRALEPLRETLTQWLGSNLTVTARVRDSADAAERERPRWRWVLPVLVAVLLGAWRAGVLPAMDPGASDSACSDVREIATAFRNAPEPGAHADPDTAFAQHVIPADAVLQAYLLETVGVGTYVHTHENVQDIDLHAEMQHQPEAREVADRHGFVRQVSRDWVDEDGRSIRHMVTQLSSERNAEAYFVHTALYACRFADAVWSVEVAGAELPGLGMRIRYEDGTAVQVSWTRGGRRHYLGLLDPQRRPDRALVERLVGQAAPLDDGAPLPETPRGVWHSGEP